MGGMALPGRSWGQGLPVPGEEGETYWGVGEANFFTGGLAQNVDVQISVPWMPVYYARSDGSGNVLVPIEGGTPGDLVTVTAFDGTTTVQVTFLVATIYAHSAADGKMYKLRNNGSARQMGLAGATLTGIGHAVIAPSNPSTVYVFDDGSRTNSFFYKTTNGGVTWTQYQALAADAITRRGGIGVVHPTDPNQVWVPVGGLNGNNTVNSLDGVYYSTDGGTTFTKGSQVPVSTDGLEPARTRSALAICPDNPSIMLFCQRESSFTLANLWRSTDRGNTWTAVVQQASVAEFNPASVCFLSDGVAYCGMAVLNDGHTPAVWRSSDYGATWTKIQQYAGEGASVAAVGYLDYIVNNNQNYTIARNSDPNRTRNLAWAYNGDVFREISTDGKATAVSVTAPRLLVCIDRTATDRILWSLDGITWTTHRTDAGKDWDSIAVV